MKRVALLAVLALCFAPAPAPAFPFYALLRIPPHPPDPDPEAERTGRSARPASGLDFVLSTFDKPIISKFRNAWQRSGNGTTPIESVVLILKMADGSYGPHLPNPTNQYKRFSFAWHPATVAIVHTHPNNSPPRPEDDDIKLADKFNVPIFTLTIQGMFVYNPATRKITKVLDGLQWQEDTAWQKVHAQLASR